MSLYDAAKDAVKFAQKLDNLELTQKLLDLQAQALEMQEKIFMQSKKITEYEAEIVGLQAKKKLTYEKGHGWIIDPMHSERKLCPVCFNRDGFENPLEMNGGDAGYCRTCKKAVE